MKHYIKIVLVGMVFLLGGCSLMPEVTVQKAIKKSLKENSFLGTLEMKVRYESEQGVIETNYVETIQEDKVMGTSKTSSSMHSTMNGNELISLKMDAYIKSDKKKTTLYYQELSEEKWFKTEYKESKMIEKPVLYFVEALKNSKNAKIKNHKSKEKGISQYEMTLPKEEIKEIFDNSNLNQTIEKEIIFLVSVDKKGRVVKMEADLKNAINEGQEVPKETILTITFSKWNEINVEIPKDVVNTAVVGS